MRRIGALFYLGCFAAGFCLMLTATILNYLPGAFATPVAAENGRNRVVVLEVNGPIVPVVSHYLSRGIERAEGEGAVCLINLNTPGGLYNVTQEIVTMISNAKTPVIVFVGTSGGWAASAGAFITMGAHAAVMAPGTRIGAAHPVTMGGQQEDGVPAEKIAADASAWMRSLAELRGRDAGLAEEMVTKSRSFSAAEAVKLELVDLIARDVPEVCRKLSGKRVTLADGHTVTLQLSGAVLEEMKPNRVESFLGTLLNPDIAYILLTIGMAGLMVEIYHPGLIIPGVIGGISLLLGLYSMGSLDAYWGGIILILLAFGFFIAEAFAPTHGVLGTGGVVSFIFGSLLLFSMRKAGFGVSIGLIAAMSMALAALTALLVTAVVRGQKRRVLTGLEGLVGRQAVARTDLRPDGKVFLEGEMWQAVSEEGDIRAGEKVEVMQNEGMSLKVRRFDRQ
ncbi:MAG: nodulation protein NfeD [Bacillota bacterium]